MMNIKESDVFDFRYKPEVVKNSFSPYHCFDGILIVRKDKKEEFYLEDTYWSNGRTFTLDEALAKGTLRYVFNLDKVEKTSKRDLNYYDDKDIVILRYGHGYSTQCFIRKGAKKSKEKMLAVIKKQISDAKIDLSCITDRIERDCVTKTQIESGNLNVFL